MYPLSGLPFRDTVVFIQIQPTISANKRQPL
jgi:hypothetical protein